MKKRIRNIPVIICLQLFILFGALFAHQSVKAEPGLVSISKETETKTTQHSIRKKMIIIGDSYGLGYTMDGSVDPEKEAWPVQVISRIGTPDSIALSKIGAGFVKSNEGDSFTTLLEKAWEMSDDPDSVEEIIVCGGFNDMYYPETTIYYAAQYFANSAGRLFPNAKIHIGMVSWEDNNADVESQILHNSLPAYRRTAELNGLNYISGCEYIFQNSVGAFSQDHFHPNAYGQTLLADYITRYLQNKNYYTGLKLVDGNWYWFENGVVNKDYTGLKMNEYGWWYVEGGKVNFTYNGFASNAYGWWYLEKGTIALQKNDILKGLANTDSEKEGEDAWWYVRNGKVTDAQTVAQNTYGWWFVNDGKVDFSYTGIQWNEYGWWYVKDGKVDFSYNGFASNAYGWWYLEKGTITFQKNDILKGSANLDPELAGEETWWFIVGSRVTRAETVAHNAYGWWYVNDGRVDFTYNGIGSNDYGSWYIRNGQVIFDYNGFVKCENGWWLIQNGKVDNEKEKVVYGHANILPEADAETAWWLVRDGKVTDATTVAENEYGYWYVKNGKVDFTFSNYVFINNCIWLVTNGKATLIARY